MTIPDRLASRHQAEVDRLSRLRGAAFDRAYARAQVEGQNGRNPAVKDFANPTLPTLKEHLSMSRDLTRATMASNSADRSK